MKKKMMAMLLTGTMLISMSGNVMAAQVSTLESFGQETVRAEMVSDTEDTFKRGTINGNQYENEIFDLKITLPDGWAFVTEEELADITSYTQDMLKDNELVKDQIDSGVSFTDMYGYAGDMTSTCNVAIQKLTAMQMLLNIENHMDALADVVREAYEDPAMGMSDVQVKADKITIGDTTYSCLRTQFIQMDVQNYVLQLVKTSGSYSAFFTVSSYQTDITDSLVEQMLS